MAKRFFETTIWTQNQWFRKLKPTTKLFWFYLLGNCDNVGVWEEDWELVSFIIGETVNKDEIFKDLQDKIYLMSHKKIWVTDFCNFQYGVLNEESADNPRKSYITLLKKHGLWEAYLYPSAGVALPLGRGCQGTKDKDKEQEED